MHVWGFVRRRRGLSIMATILVLSGLVLSGLMLSGCYPPVPPGEDLAARWAHTLSGPSNEDEFDGVAAGANGSVFATGKFEQHASIGGTTLTSAGKADIPLARFNALGGVVWIERFGGPGEDNLFDIDADDTGAVGTGWFEETVEFGSVTLTSAGGPDCVIVSVANDGSVRWARRFGGSNGDGCNEVSLAADGSIVTSIDTQGGWTPPGLPPIENLSGSDTVLLRLNADGQPQWARRVGGPGAQRGKSLAVAPDGSVSFGGDSRGDVNAAGTVAAVPGAGRDAWLSRWTPSGDLAWLHTWGGPGDDIAKGVSDDGSSVFAVGTFTGVIDIDGIALDAGTSDDIAVARFNADGTIVWATSVTAPTAIGGAEIVNAPDGGILFGGIRAAGMQFRSPSGAATNLDVHNGGTAWLAHYRPDGSVAFATTIAGTAFGGLGEIDRNGERVYADVALRGDENTINGTPLPTQGKDASVWALDLAPVD